MAEVVAGTVIAEKYRLEATIGEGGMASVWRAVHLGLDAPVAVKVLDLTGTKKALARHRFEREAKLAATIKHRNIVDVLDFGVHNGHPYMVMELLRGESLGKRLASDRATTDVELFDIAAQALSGLAAAHDHGVVHRDVKPDNIFLVRDADGEYPKVLDFGISRDTRLDSEGIRVTGTGVLVGTPLYMSPEQARGLKDVDRRADLWSIGAILYEALAGELPFDSENMGDILIRIATEDMPPIQDHRPDLPDDVAEVIMKALRRHREDRWQDAREMREALAEAASALSGQAVKRYRSDAELRPSTARPPSYADPPRAASIEPPEPTRRRWSVVAGALVLVAVGAGLFSMLGGEVRFRSEPGVPTSPPPADPSIAATPPPRMVQNAEPAAQAPTPEEATVAPEVTEPSPPAEAPAPPVEAPRERPAEPGPPTRASRRRRRPAHRPAPPPAEATRPTTEPTLEDPPAEEPPLTRDEGGFLRDLDF